MSTPQQDADVLLAEHQAKREAGITIDTGGASVSDHIERALEQAHQAITAYHVGDRAWAERWLLKAYEANR